MRACSRCRDKAVKAPGWASLMTLLSDTAYHSFIGEVEALNTTTIRRLTRSRRHQLLAIAPDTRFQPSREYCPWLGFNRSDSGGPRSGLRAVQRSHLLSLSHLPD